MSALALGLTLPFSSFGAVALTPPTVAPVLSASASLGSTTALLGWTESNKTTSSGFGYKIMMKIDAGAESQILTSVNLTEFYDVPGAAGETYTFRVIPYNDAGDGPASNAASVILPGI